MTYYKYWNKEDWYNGKYNCRPYKGVRYEKDIDFWITASPSALMNHLNEFNINVPIEKYRDICDAVKKEEYGGNYER